MDLLEFIGSLIMSEGEGIHLGLDIFGLGILQAALNAGAQALARWDSGRALHAPVQLFRYAIWFTQMISTLVHLLGAIAACCLCLAGDSAVAIMHSAWCSMWECLCRHEALLLLLRQDVWGALAMAACRPNLAALSHACQVSPKQ